MNIEQFVNDYLQEHHHDVLLCPYNALVEFADSFKKKMMKEAVEGMVRKDGTIGYFEFSNEQQFHSLLEQFQDCDKVRIVVCKKED